MRVKILARRGWHIALLVVLVAFSAGAGQARALGSDQTPQNGSVGVEGKISAPPPKTGPTITTPGNGQTVSSVPITIAGLCPSNLLIKVFSNNIFIGAAQCKSGSYSLKANLFPGKNQLVARGYDALDQASPDSNTVNVTFNDGQFAQFGTRVSLTSNYAELGANPGSELDWPIIVSGGVGPYAVSVDWGDGTTASLQTVKFAGTFTIKHTYNSAGIYQVIVRATDANGTTAFLQLVGVANGKVGQGTTGSGTSSGSGSEGGGLTIKTIVIWWPMLLLLPLIVAAFWLGRKHEIFAIRRQLEKSRDQAK